MILFVSKISTAWEDLLLCYLVSFLLYGQVLLYTYILILIYPLNSIATTTSPVLGHFGSIV